jgi:hypothetical protein
MGRAFRSVSPLSDLSPLFPKDTGWKPMLH